jgi:hypothetical protein
VPDSRMLPADRVRGVCDGAEAEGRCKSPTRLAARIRIPAADLGEFEYPCPPVAGYPCPFAPRSPEIRIAMPIPPLINLRSNTS